MRMRRRTWAVLVLGLVVWTAASAAWAEPPRCVVLMIGDGMGPEQVKAAGLYANGEAGTLPFEKYFVGTMRTCSLDHGGDKKGATDSAAAATAMATGQKTNNGVISQTPDGRDLPTVLELLAKAGKLTGLVTTVPITHATPAGFGAHVPKRTQYAEIAEDYLTGSRPNLLFGAVFSRGRGMTEAKARRAGYTVLKTRADLERFVEAAAGRPPADLHVWGRFAVDMLPWEYDGPLPEKGKKGRRHAGLSDATFATAPHLSEMTRAALRLLERGPHGFFLMVEGGAIDWACHDNCIEWAVGETVEFAEACRAVLDWAKRHPDALVIITADHETGGLKVVRGRGKGKVPEVTWSSKGHTDAEVNVYAVGPGSEALRGRIDNTDLFRVMMGEVQKAARPAAEPVGAAQ